MGVVLLCGSGTGVEGEGLRGTRCRLVHGWRACAVGVGRVVGVGVGCGCGCVRGMCTWANTSIYIYIYSHTLCQRV